MSLDRDLFEDNSEHFYICLFGQLQHFLQPLVLKIPPRISPKENLQTKTDFTHNTLPRGGKDYCAHPGPPRADVQSELDMQGIDQEKH